MGKRLISAAVSRLYKTYATALIDELSTRTSVILVTVTSTPCPNCTYDTTNKSSSGQYNGTGPSPFTNGMCPVCQNAGNIQSDQQEKIQANARWGSLTGKEAPDQPYLEGELPEGMVRLKTIYKNMALINSCNYALIDGIRCSKYGRPKPRGLTTYVTCTAVFQRDD